MTKDQLKSLPQSRPEQDRSSSIVLHPSINIYVLNWNGIQFLPACLSALSALEYPDCTIYLIDNASEDGSLSYVREAFPQVKIIQNDRNLGYAAGNNSGLKNSTAEISILVNPDIVVNPDWLSQLVAVFTVDETIGIAGCKLFYPGENLLQHAGGFITHPRAMPGHRGMGSADQGAYKDIEDVEYVIGAAIAFRGSMLAEIGYLDEGFFMYFEDADFCQRALKAGYRVVFVPGAAAIHDESAIAIKGSPAYLRRFHTGRWRFILKHFDPREILQATMPAENLWLANLADQEQLAIDHAYRQTQARLQDILKDRARDGGSVVAPEIQEQIKEGILNLRKTAVTRPAGQPYLETLSNKTLIHEEPFHSSLPVIGPLIAGIRSLWANIAVRPYVSRLIEQQNQLNRHTVEEIRDDERQMEMGETLWLEQDEDRLQHKQRLQSLRNEVRQTYNRIFTLEERMKKIEKNDVDQITKPDDR